MSAYPRSTRTIVLGFAVFLLVVSSRVLAAVPSTMTYQARLTEPGGNPLSGNFNMTFQIFPSPTGGTVLWREPHNNVTGQVAVDAFGMFEVLLGRDSALTAQHFPGDGSERYLEVEVNGEVLQPRKLLNSVPYAFTATAQGELWQTDGTSVYRPTGNVGIGTNAPNSVLDIVKATGSHELNAVNYSAVNPHLRLHALAAGNQQSEIRFLKADTPLWSIVNDVNGDDAQNFGLKNWVAGTVPLFVDAAGNVGIGTTNPAAFFRLDVSGTGHFVYYAEVSNDASRGPQLGLVNRLPQGRSYSVSSGEIPGRPSQFNVVDETAGGLPRLSIDESGNVGIDNATPHAKLHVTGGDIAVETQGRGLILRATDGANCYRITVSNTGMLLPPTLVPCP